MRYVNRGKSGAYLVCDGARRGLGCEKTGWRYDQFEASFLSYVQELDLESIVVAKTRRRSERVWTRRSPLWRGASLASRL